MANMWAAIAVGIVVVAPVVGWGIWRLWWRLPKRLLGKLTADIVDAKDRADVEDNFRKTIGQAIGGFVVLVGAGAAYLQFWQQQQDFRDRSQAAHELLISNQVSKGFDQLGSDNP